MPNLCPCPSDGIHTFSATIHSSALDGCSSHLVEEAHQAVLSTGPTFRYRPAAGAAARVLAPRTNSGGAMGCKNLGVSFSNRAGICRYTSVVLISCVTEPQRDLPAYHRAAPQGSPLRCCHCPKSNRRVGSTHAWPRSTAPPALPQSPTAAAWANRSGQSRHHGSSPGLGREGVEEQGARCLDPRAHVQPSVEDRERVSFHNGSIRSRRALADDAYRLEPGARETAAG